MIQFLKIHQIHAISILLLMILSSGTFSYIHYMKSDFDRARHVIEQESFKSAIRSVEKKD